MGETEEKTWYLVEVISNIFLSNYVAVMVSCKLRQCLDDVRGFLKTSSPCGTFHPLGPHFLQGRCEAHKEGALPRARHFGFK